MVRVFNTVSLILIIFCLVDILSFKIKENSYNNFIFADIEDNQLKTASSPKNNSRGIYYIILDGHASASTLKEFYSYDLDRFIEYLTNKGFYIADKSMSNHSNTFLSLASSLNMNYFTEDGLINTEVNSKSKSMQPPNSLIKNNKVMNFLKSRGYKFIHFGSGWGPTNQNEYADYDIHCGGGNEFSMVALQTTILMPIVNYFFRFHIRDRILCTFSKLAKVHEIEGPKFVFAHINCPHPPFVFGAEGEKVLRTELALDGTVWEHKDAYLNQLKFIDKKLIDLIEYIMMSSKLEPIIILQSDHGPGVPKSAKDLNDIVSIRMRILNAIYLPPNNNAVLYKSITPVNTFRIIFNTYFETNYELLNDESYLSKSPEEPYSFTRVTDIIK